MLSQRPENVNLIIFRDKLIKLLKNEHIMFASISSFLSSWGIGQGYTLLFIAMLIEGPAATAAGSFAAALGVFDIWLVLLLSVLGNLIPDAFLYGLGYLGRKSILDNYGRYLRLNETKTNRLEKLYHKHIGKTLFVVKLIPALALPGLIVAGIARVPLKKYAWWCTIITIPTSGIYMVLGYYFGAVYARIIRYIDYGGYLLAASIIVLILISYFGGKKISTGLARKIEKI
jgi:membrane protein DedA with SNARE-associated domain